MTNQTRESGGRRLAKMFVRSIVRGVGWTIGKDLVRLFEGKR